MFETLLLFRSLRGSGLKWFIHIDISRHNHKTWFNAVRNYLIITYKLTEKQVDKSCINLSRACYLGYDDKAFLNKQLLNNEIDMKKSLFDPLEWRLDDNRATGTNPASAHPFFSCQV